MWKNHTVAPETVLGAFSRRRLVGDSQAWNNGGLDLAGMRFSQSRKGPRGATTPKTPHIGTCPGGHEKMERISVCHGRCSPLTTVCRVSDPGQVARPGGTSRSNILRSRIDCLHFGGWKKERKEQRGRVFRWSDALCLPDLDCLAPVIAFRRAYSPAALTTTPKTRPSSRDLVGRTKGSQHLFGEEKYGGENTSWDGSSTHWTKINMKRMGVGASSHLWHQPEHHLDTAISYEFNTCISPSTPAPLINRVTPMTKYRIPPRTPSWS